MNHSKTFYNLFNFFCIINCILFKIFSYSPPEIIEISYLNKNQDKE